MHKEGFQVAKTESSAEGSRGPGLGKDPSGHDAEKQEVAHRRKDGHMGETISPDANKQGGESATKKPEEGQGVFQSKVRAKKHTLDRTGNNNQGGLKVLGKENSPKCPKWSVRGPWKKGGVCRE